MCGITNTHLFFLLLTNKQEIIVVYPALSPPTLSLGASNRVCNALALLQVHLYCYLFSSTKYYDNHILFNLFALRSVLPHIRRLGPISYKVKIMDMSKLKYVDGVIC